MTITPHLLAAVIAAVLFVAICVFGFLVAL